MSYHDAVEMAAISEGHAGGVDSPAFWADGRRLAVAAADRGMHEWEPEGSKEGDA